MRVQIPAYTDAWMRGDRFGEIVKYSYKRKPPVGSPRRTRGINELPFTIAHVKLDKSGKTIRVIASDCTVV